MDNSKLNECGEHSVFVPKPTMKAPTSMDIVRCPVSKCTCPRGGGALLCKIFRPQGARVVVETVCPFAKKNLLQIELGEPAPARELSELERITEGMNLLRAHGCEGLRNTANGLFIHVPVSVVSVSLTREMKSLGWEWHAAPSGFAFALSPL